MRSDPGSELVRVIGETGAGDEGRLEGRRNDGFRRACMMVFVDGRENVESGITMMFKLNIGCLCDCRGSIRYPDAEDLIPARGDLSH